MKRIGAGKKDRESVFILAFFIVFGLCLASMLVMALITRGATFTQTLFHADDSVHKDFFMDFFNSIRDASDFDVYSKGATLTPLASLLFHLLSRMMSPDVAATPFAKRYSMQSNQQAIVLYFVFMLICIISLSFIIKNYLQGEKNKALATVLSFGFIFIYPLFYAVERGNIIVPAMVCTAFFAFFNDSKSAAIRNLSYIVFAFGAALKFYPIVFLLLLVQQKRYKAALKTLIYFLVLFILPGFLYHGVGLLDYFKNLAAYAAENKWGQSFSIVSITGLVTQLGGGKTVAVIAEIVTCLIAAFMVFLAPKKWQKLALLAYIAVNLRLVASVYSLVFFIIPFVVFLSADNKKRTFDWGYFVLFCLLLLPLPCFWYFKPATMDWLFRLLNRTSVPNLNLVIMTPVVQLTFLVLCFDCVINFAAALKSGKSLRSFFLPDRKNLAVSA